MLSDNPFVIRYLLPEERIIKDDPEEWEAVDCNNRVVAFLGMGIKQYPTYRVLQNKVGNEPLTWEIMELIAAGENEKHDTGVVHATPFERLLHCSRLGPNFTRVDKKTRKTVPDYDRLHVFLVSLFIPQQLLWDKIDN